MIDSILDVLKTQGGDLLKSQLGLNDSEVDTAIATSKDTVESAVASEATSKGLDVLSNLFSDKENTSDSNNLLSNIGGDLLKNLVSNGFSSEKAGGIKDIILPLVINLISKKVGGDSSGLADLLGGIVGGDNKKDGGLLGNIGSGLLKNLFK